MCWPYKDWLTLTLLLLLLLLLNTLGRHCVSLSH